MIGNTLSHYKIISKLGQGGQGEVYLAEDSRLERKVALKILPEHLSERADLRERFEREARAVSSLNHPHICTLHDIGEQDGIHFLVMEHLEGETLAQRLEKGALPLEQTLEYAIQIADALDKAHRQGVVHRDLKPGNIMLVKNGAKLLDFGLAKLKATEATEENLSNLPTEQANLTAEGTILGTLQYMAPEQLEGKDTDSRTDIFAFGAVVYEMATGKKAFEGSSQASLIAAILKDDPAPMAELQPMTPQLMDWVVKRCLAKEPDERVQSAGDLVAELRLVGEAGTPEESLPAVTGPAAWRRAIPWSIAAVAIILSASTVLWRSPQPNLPASIQFMIGPSATETWTNFPWRDLVLSPNGTQLVYTANGQFYLRALAQLEARPISGTQNGLNPFYSPDGQSLGFFTSGKLWKTSLAGGTPLPICDVIGTELSGSWGLDDTIIFSAGNLGGTFSLYRISAAAGEPESIPIGKPGGDESYSAPIILPGGNDILLTVTGSDISPRIEVLSLETGERKVLLEDGTKAHYLPTGHLVYMGLSNNLMVAPFDLARLEVTGDSMTILQGVRYNDFSVSDNGTLAYFPGGSSALHEHSLVLVDRNGRETLMTEEKRDFRAPRPSPDGRRVALSIGDPGSNDVWIYDLESDSMSRFTFDEPRNGSSVWSPDSKWLVFQSGRPGEGGMVRQPADRSLPPERITSTSGRQLPGSWSSDGRFVVFAEAIRPPKGGFDIGFLAMEEGNEPEFILDSPAVECCPRLSPDGKWLAYVSDEEGRDHVYVSPFPKPDVKWMISEEEEGGGEPVWSPDGSELFYRSGDKMMVVSIKAEGKTLNAGRPRALFRGSYVSHSIPAGLQYYDISPDGKRFLMLKEGDIAQEEPQINVVLNWFEELKRLVPTDN